MCDGRFYEPSGPEQKTDLEKIDEAIHQASKENRRLRVKDLLDLRDEIVSKKPKKKH